MTKLIELHCLDCVKGMDELLPDDSVDVVVTSPPYNLGIKYRKYNDTQKHQAYMAWTKDWLASVYRVLSANGSFFLNLGGCPRKPLLPLQVALAAADIFVLQNTFHWIKAISLDREDGILSTGHFKPINSPRFVNECHEFIFHLTKTGKVPLDRLALGVPYTDKTNVKRWSHSKGKDLRCRGNAWFIPYTTICNRDKQRPHPATFPPALVQNCIRIHGLFGTGHLDLKGPERLTVLDPFIGIGNTAIAALNLGVGRVIGFDIDESYLADASALIDRRRKEIDSNLKK